MRIWIFAASALAVVTIFAFTCYRRAKRPASVLAKPTAESFKPPATLGELMKMTPAQLDHCDLALMDLLCAQGLPGSENVDIPQMLATLDQWAAKVNWYTQLNYYQFVQNPENFGYSEGRYRMMILVTVLGQKFHVHYNPALMDPTIPGETFYGDSRNVFINGLIGPYRMGTCSSLPVLYVAVAQRLGYPLHLAMTKLHFFAQWNGSTEHFNVECTTWGYREHEDDYYKKWPVPLTDADLKQNRYLKPLSGAEELSMLLENRAITQVVVVEDYRAALGCVEKASELTPTWPELSWMKDQLMSVVSDISQKPDLDEIQRLTAAYRHKHGFDLGCGDPYYDLAENPTADNVMRVNTQIAERNEAVIEAPMVGTSAGLSEKIPAEIIPYMPKEIVAAMSTHIGLDYTPPLQNGYNTNMTRPAQAMSKQLTMDHRPSKPFDFQLPFLNLRPSQ